MPLAALVGVDTVGGGLITGPGSLLLRVGGVPVAQVGDAVADHGTGSHNAATIIGGALLLRTAGIPVAITGSPASCGDTVLGSATLLDVAS